MSISSRMLSYLASHPVDFMKFRATGRLPTVEKVTSPLIRFLEAMPPRERLQWRQIGRLDTVGYATSFQFENAERLLRWLKPQEELIGNESTPAESFKIGQFQRPVTREMFAACCKISPPSPAPRVPVPPGPGVPGHG